MNHVFNSVTYSLGNENLALNKPAEQSTTLNGNHRAGIAVNGLYGDFTHTLYSGATRWWKVDLQGRHSIAKIKIYNRKRCCRKC